MKRTAILACILTTFAFASRPTTTPKIQIALLLDASGSMDGLINQAQGKLWQLVTELATAKKNGQTPALEVALYMYGHDSLASKDHYVQCLQPLTTDLDRISEVLFQIRTNGGEEYCGAAIQNTLTQSWSSHPKDYKAIFIAGNEPFDQGPVSFKQACEAAIGKGIVVNTIFCGDAQEGIRTHWQAAAHLADGAYMTLDHQRAIAQVRTPQDDEILKLGKLLNDTYLGFGQTGADAKQRQKKQDTNAASISEEAAVNRTVAKASPAYQTESWDLVAAVEKGNIRIEEMEDSSLPQELQGKSNPEKQKYLEELTQKRQDLTQQIARLKAEREQHLATLAAQKGTLDNVMLNAIRAQITRLDYDLPK